MTRNDKVVAVPEAAPVAAQPTKLKYLGGSDSDAFNARIANSVLCSFWYGSDADEEERKSKLTVVQAALGGIGPRDELEGMLAAQLVASNAAAMECYRWAMIPEQSFEGRKENLNQANKLSRTYVTLLEALNRHRGKGGEQKVTVEHVHVHAGGQAVVGSVQAGGGGGRAGNQRQPHAQAALTHAPVTSLWREGEDEGREPVPIAGHAERSLPDARRGISGSAEG